MPEVLAAEKKATLTTAVLSTLAFFSLYDLPISSKRLHELLYECHASLADVEEVLEFLSSENKITRAGNVYSLKSWKASDLRDRQVEIGKKWNKIDRFTFWLSILPFVRMVSVINSLALGTADADSDIDFFRE